EAGHSAARQALDVARAPRAEAERRVGRLEAEAKALAKLIDVEAKKLWPPAIDLLTVEKGYEAALGAALGDDLEAPVDPAAPIRWAGANFDPADPALPEGAAPLSRHVSAPPDLARPRPRRAISAARRRDTPTARATRTRRPSAKQTGSPRASRRWRKRKCASWPAATRPSRPSVTPRRRSKCCRRSPNWKVTSRNRA